MEHALPRRTAGIPRTWSLCMTSENHGTVGPAGCKFSHAPEKHERVLVVEVPTAAGAPADQINIRLVGARQDLPVAEFEGYVDGEPLVRWMDRDNMPRVGTKLFAGAQAIDSAGDLANEASGQVAVDRALRAAQAWVNEEYMCGRRMGKGEPAMSDRADAAKTECTTAILALAAPVAAQASQAAVPTDEVIVTALHACAIDTRPSKYGFTELQVDATNVLGIRAVYMKIAAAMQASTSGERQEGGAA